MGNTWECPTDIYLMNTSVCRSSVNECDIEGRDIYNKVY